MMAARDLDLAYLKFLLSNSGMRDLMSYGRYLDVIEAKRLVVLGADDQVVQMQQTYTIPAIVTAPEQQEAPQACMGGHQNYGNALSQVMQPSVPPTQGGENQTAQPTAQPPCGWCENSLRLVDTCSEVARSIMQQIEDKDVKDKCNRILGCLVALRGKIEEYGHMDAGRKQ